MGPRAEPGRPLLVDRERVRLQIRCAIGEIGFLDDRELDGRKREVGRLPVVAGRQ
jgi:hypothetical protein